MYSLPTSAAYRQHYRFQQNQLATMLDFDQYMAQLGGLCSVLAMDWLQARLCQRTFVVSVHTLRDNAWALTSAPDHPPLAYCAPLPQGAAQALSLAQCRAVLAWLPAQGGLALPLTATPEQAVQAVQAAMLCVVREDDNYTMFDCDSGEYSAVGLDDCARWLFDLCALRAAAGLASHWCADLSPMIFRAPRLHIRQYA